MIVALEGIDGSGKATQAGLLAERLRSEFACVKLKAYPNYSTATGALIQGLLEGAWGPPKPDGPLVMQALQTINRYEDLEMLQEWSRAGVWALVLDRYYGSSLAYGGTSGVDVEFVRRISKGLPVPDVWVLIDVPVEESVARRPFRRDLYEQDFSFLRGVRERYLKLFSGKEPGLGGAREVVEGVGTVEQVRQAVWAAVERHL